MPESLLSANNSYRNTESAFLLSEFFFFQVDDSGLRLPDTVLTGFGALWDPSLSWSPHFLMYLHPFQAGSPQKYGLHFHWFLYVRSYREVSTPS